MAVTVQEGFLRQRPQRQLQIPRPVLAREKFLEKQCIRRQRLGYFTFEQSRKFVAERQQAARFKTDDRDCAALTYLARQGQGRPVPADEQEALLAAVRWRRSLVAERKIAQQRLHDQVNALCPGYVWTPLVEKQVDGQAKAHGIGRDAVIRDVFLAEQPTKRFVTVEEVAGAVAFLCGEHAASITGIALPIDGGWTAH